MASERIALHIGRDGSIRAVTLGIKGKECLEYLPLLEDLLDAEIADSAFTADYTAEPVSLVEDEVVEPVTETAREPGS